MSKNTKLILALVILAIAAVLILWNLGVFRSSTPGPAEVPVIDPAKPPAGGARVAPGTPMPK
jgi:hypothetical protein